MPTKFNQNAYDFCDYRAKKALRNFLDSLGIYTQVHEDYGADIKSFEEVMHEVEIKSTYKDEFKWDTVHIPARKKKLLKGKRIIFWVMNHDCTKAIMIDGKHMKDAYIENVPNTRNPGGELFYDIPINLCKEVSLCT